VNNDPQPVLELRTVKAARGWAWIVDGTRLFLRKPISSIVTLLILFVIMKLIGRIPVLGLVAMLLMPVFLAGLMDGCKAVDEGRPLALSYLANGFRRNTGWLVTLGGIYLIGNVFVFMIIVGLGGDAFVAIAKTLTSGAQMTPQVAEKMQAATLTVTKAALVGSLASLPLLMALWFAPLLTYFHDVRPWPALQASFVACVKNTLPMFIYGLVLFVALMVLVPIGIRLGFYDLGVWLMAPALVPSIYASYKDIFVARGAPVPENGSLPS
jgi:hypothetical protein